MAQNKFLKHTLATLAVAAVAAGLLTSAGAFKDPKADQKTASAKLAATCGIAYDKAVYTELYGMVDKQAASLDRLGLGNTKADVCAALTSVVAAKTDKKVDFVQYDHASKVTRAVLAAAVLFQTSHQDAKLNRDTVRSLADAFDVSPMRAHTFKAGTAKPEVIRDEAIGFMQTELALAGKGDLDSTAIKDKEFSSFVYNLNLSP